MLARVELYSGKTRVINLKIDPEKFFNLEGLSNISELDFYCTLGNITSEKPMRFNGLGFSIKLGILCNELTDNDVQGGLNSQNRVVKRVRKE